MAATATSPVRQHLSADERDAVRRLVDRRRRQLLRDAPSDETLRKVERELVRRVEAPPLILNLGQREVLGMLVDGLTVAEVAAELGLDQRTVRARIRLAMTKLGARTQCQAVIFAVARGLV